MRFLVLSISLFIFTIFLRSQSYTYLEDAYRLSQLDYQGTARSQGMASAFGALGGDLSSLSINPAGLGVYRSSEITFTPGFNNTSYKTEFLGKSRNASNYSGNLNNIGVVFNKNFENSDSEIMGTSFAFNVNRLADFNRNILIAGDFPTTSFVQYLSRPSIDGSNLNDLDPFWEGLAYDAEIIDSDSNGIFFNYLENMVGQKKYIQTSGGKTEYQIAYGLNFSHKVYIGASFSIVSSNYIMKYDITETDINDVDKDLSSYTYHHEIDSWARGVNAKLGVLVRPNENYRFGLAIHFPTFYSINEVFDAHLTTYYDDGRRYTDTPNDGYYSIDPGTQKVDFITPFRLVLSNALVLNKEGLLSVDYEIINYRKMQYEAGVTNNGIGVYEYDNSDLNTEIDQYMRIAHNVRVGVEKRIGPTYFRGGYSFVMSPFKRGILNDDAHIHAVSCGLGYRDSKFFADMALVNTFSKYSSSLFSDDRADLFDSNIHTFRFVATVGFRFQ